MIHEAQIFTKSKLIKDSTFFICSAVIIGLCINVAVSTINVRECL